MGTAWNIRGNVGPAGGLVLMSPSSSTKLWWPGPLTLRVGSQPVIIVARSEPNRQPLDLYQSHTYVGSPPDRRRMSARQYWSLQLPLAEYTMCNCPFGSLIASGPSLMYGLPTTRSQLSRGCEMTYRLPVGVTGSLIRAM